MKLQRGLTLGSLSLTPLVDVVFLLLIFFLVATRFEQEERELELQLPLAGDAQPLVAEPQEIFINVSQEGLYYLGGKVLDRDALQRILARAWLQNPGNQRVVIRADADSKTRFVVDVMNLCHRANIRCSIATE